MEAISMRQLVADYQKLKEHLDLITSG